MPIGYTTQCEKVPIASDDFINEARIDYKGGEITMFQIQTNNGNSYTRGEDQESLDFSHVQTFTKTDPMIGIYGFEYDYPPKIDAIGFIIYSCKWIFYPDANQPNQNSDTFSLPSGYREISPPKPQEEQVDDNETKDQVVVVDGDGDYQNAAAPT